LIKRRKFPKIFFGWRTVLASGILNLWGHGFRTYGFSALFKPIASELGFSRAVTSAAASVSRLQGGFEAPLSGWASDRYGPRWIVISGVFLIGVGLILMSFMNSMWVYYIVWGVLVGTGTNMALGLPADVAIANWFVKKRGLAMSTKWVFSGLSGVLILPLVAWLINTQGWRMTCAIGGVVMGLVGLPLAWFFFKQHRPEYYGLLPDGATAGEEVIETDQMIDKGVEYAAEVEEVEFTLRQAMRTPTYWLLMVAGAMPALAEPVMNIHCIPFLTDIGIDPLKAAGMMAIMISASIPTRFIGGLIVDRVSRNRLRFLIAGIHAVQVAGISIFLLNQTVSMIYVWFILYGIGIGAAITIFPFMMVRYFGRKAFGSIDGSIALLMTPIGVAAPIYTGWIYDTSGSYTTAFALLAVLLSAAGIIFLFIKPPKTPAQVTDIRKIV